MMKDWQWVKEDNTIVLRRPFMQAKRYDESTIREALKNVHAQQSTYATHEAWIRSIEMFAEGLTLFD